MAVCGGVCVFVGAGVGVGVLSKDSSSNRVPARMRVCVMTGVLCSCLMHIGKSVRPLQLLARIEGALQAKPSLFMYTRACAHTHTHVHAHTHTHTHRVG